ncbi:uncharacterized protein LOC120405988 isoform X10 [Mauremys reevesii]|uniref:uncharacterized protein LOC120405988 isoform X10 n=1 Tax=Mauremys reevesii TaxID=260615 RepID=UPI00193EDAC1|nr:uncharacterized protein LOC120405988 isoform X10 [Mauremys reevesii]
MASMLSTLFGLLLKRTWGIFNKLPSQKVTVPFQGVWIQPLTCDYFTSQSMRIIRQAPQLSAPWPMRSPYLTANGLKA